uniref:Protein disulfide-isomerase n=1 Tax=Trypanosoma congolense (strain IL3000) TaxID=1068625 RepID=G0UX22_TRYCI|nr:protein disulfide isomerase [Trypanosoma congolense IL3000]
MMRNFFLAILLVAFIRGSSAESTKLTKDNFNATIASSEIFLVKFYIDSCGYCQMLAPEWEKAANETIENAKMGEVDCHDQKELAESFNIEGFPTIILFRNGKMADRYNGAREKDALIKYLKANVGPAIIPASNKEHIDEVKEKNEIVCVGLTADAKSSLSTTLTEAAQSLRTSIKFLLVTDPTYLPDEKQETIIVYRKGGEKEVYDGPMELEKLTLFLRVARVGYGDEVTPVNYQYYANISSPIGWTMIRPNETVSTDLKDKLAEIGKKVRSQVVILWVDAVKHQVWKGFDVPDDAKFPVFMIMKQDVKYFHTMTEVVTPGSLEKFITDFVEGRVEPTIKSLPIPEKETVGGKTTIVAKTMDKHLTSGKDMLILFFAPWCGHCKNFAPTYEKIAAEFNESNIIVAELDATANYVNSSIFKITGFPTVFFVPSGGKPILFEGDRSLGNVSEFVRKHATTLKEKNKTSEKGEVPPTPTGSSAPEEKKGSGDDVGKQDL